MSEKRKETNNLFLDPTSEVETFKIIVIKQFSRVKMLNIRLIHKKRNRKKSFRNQQTLHRCLPKIPKNTAIPCVQIETI